MLAILVVLAGLALVFGARGLAESILKGVFGLVLVLSFLPGLLNRFTGRCDPAGPPSSSSWWSVLIPAALALAGFVALRTRASRMKAREAWRKRHLHPRARVVAPPPAADEPEDG